MTKLVIGCVSTVLLAGALAATVQEGASGGLDVIVSKAAEVKNNSRTIERTLKSKSFDVAQVRQLTEANRTAIEEMNQELAKVKTAGALTEEWKQIDTMLNLLSIFNDQQLQMLEAGDPARNRSSLRAMAAGQAVRAEKLEQSAQRLRPALASNQP
jgi:TolA-binding protein